MKAGLCWILISKFSRPSDPYSKRFRRVGSALSVAKHFREHGLRFPRLVRQPGCPVEVGWGDLEHNRVTRILRNPRYAGAFFYGRTRFHKKIDGGGRVQRLPRQEWHTLIREFSANVRAAS